MNMKRNLIAHYETGTSDKVYMACVRFDGADSWTVIGKWGKRGGGTLSSQPKKTCDTETEAILEQKKLFHEKLAKGYQDVDSGLYLGPVSRSSPEIAANLEAEVSAGAPVVPVRKPEEKAAKDKGKEKVDSDEMAAVCVDRAGLEDRFDEGIEYVFEEHADEAMLWVYDKLGEKREYFKERFRLVRES